MAKNETAAVATDAPVKAKGKRIESKVKPIEFIKIWQAAEDLDEVAAKTGLMIESARSRARTMVERGVPLKALTRIGGSSRTFNDYAALAALAQGALGDDDELMAKPVKRGPRAPKAAAAADPVAAAAGIIDDDDAVAAN